MSEKVATPCSTTPALPSTTMTAVPFTPCSTPSLTTISASMASPHTTSSGLVTTSVTSHPMMHSVQQTMAHPSVPPSPIPQMQVIQQPLHSPTYLPHLYSPQQQLLMPGNIAMSPSIQVISAGKSCVPNQLTTQMLAGKQMLQGQSNYMPSTTNQTLVIGQLGVLPSQSSMMPTHAKQVADSQKVRPYTHTAVTVAGTQVLNSSQFKQLTSQATLMSSPQLITSQAPTMIASQSQIINGLQAISTSLPPGLSWATHGGLQSHVITAQNPIFIRSSQQQDMFIQSQPATPTPIQPQPNMGQLLQQQHHNAKQKHVHTLELAPHIQPKMQATSVGTKTLTSILPSVAPIRPASSVATQTNAMTHGAHFHPRPQIKHQRLKPHVNRAMPGPGGVHLQHKADAANQTKIILASQHNPSTIQMKMQADSKINCAKPPPQNVVVPAVTSEVPTNVNMITIQPAMNPQLAAVEEPMDTSESAGVMPTKDIQLATPNKPLTLANTSMSEPMVRQQQQQQQPDEVRPGHVSISIGGGGRPPGPVHKMRILGNLPNQEPASTTMHTQLAPGVQLPPAVVLPPRETHTPQPPLGSENTKEKQPQKAIVKPHVLTHVIEGYVIQEAPEPFPVNRSSMVTEFVAPKPSVPVKETPEEARIAESEEMAVTPPCPQSTVAQGIQLETWSSRDKREAKCEFCGKVDGKSRFKRSKRFCSTSCAKRFNVGCTKRLGLFTPPETDSGKYPKKKKHGLKIKKGLRKIQSGRLSYNAEEWNVVESPNKEDETNSSNSGAESSLSPITPQSQKDIMDLDMTDAEHRKNPQKWSVQDVFDFIKELPGCVDYADEFRLQEIDGQALMLLKEDHLMTAMNMKLGPALKICAKINSLKDELQRQ